MSMTYRPIGRHLRKIGNAGPAFLAGWVALMLVSGAAAADLSTPEAAVNAYIEAVAAHDLDRVLAASAVDAMSANYDFEGFVDRQKALTAVTPVPSTDTMLVSINRATFAAQIARQVQFLTYGLLDRSSLEHWRPHVMDRTDAAAFANDINPARLETLIIGDISAPQVSAESQERDLRFAAGEALIYGADEQVERGAVINFEGASYVLGFTLLRYGDNWGVSSQSSPLLGTNPMGSPLRVTP